MMGVIKKKIMMKGMVVNKRATNKALHTILGWCVVYWIIIALVLAFVPWWMLLIPSYAFLVLSCMILLSSAFMVILTGETVMSLIKYRFHKNVV